MTAVDLLGAALGYASRGWPVLPLHSPDRDRGCTCKDGLGCASPAKHPRTQHGVRDATTDEATIRGWWARWPNANVGIAAGGILVIDVDGEVGEASLAQLEIEHGELPSTLEARTGSGGRHLVFEHPGGEIKNKVALAPKLDIRSAGGYIVAPPSLHAGGHRYEWLSDAQPAQLGPHPVVELLRRAGRRTAPAKPPPPPAPPPPPPQDGDRTLRRLRGIVRATCDRIAQLQDGRRAALLAGARTLGGYFHLGLPRAEARAALLDAAVRCGADQKHDVAKHVDYGLDTGSREPLPLPPDDDPPAAAPRRTGPDPYPPSAHDASPRGKDDASHAGGTDTSPPPVLARLAAAVAQVQLGDADARAETIASLQPLVSELGAAWLTHEAAIRAELERMRGIRALGGAINRLQAQIEDAAERHEAAARQTRQRSSPPPSAAAFALPIPGLAAPEGYEIDALGVWHIQSTPDGDEVRRLLTEAPLVVTALAEDVHHGGQLVELAWRERSAADWTRRIVGREVAADSRRLVTDVARFGAPVHSGNARLVVGYLAAFIAQNRLPRKRVSHCTGWVGPVFLLGRTPIGPPEHCEGLELGPDGAADLVANSLRPRGTWRGWLEAWEIARKYPRLALAVYASVVPAFLDLCTEIPPFFVSFAGVTSVGKTGALRFAASVWGSPSDGEDGGLVQSWDLTRTYLERLATGTRGLPLLLDEAQRARRGRPGESFVAQTIYDLTQGRGKGRGAPTGIQQQATWRSVCLSTGEQPLTSYSQDGGTRARVLEFWGSPWGGRSPLVVPFERAIADHHGHLGPRVIRALQSHADVRGWLAERFRAAVDVHQRGLGSSVETRVAKYVAALDVAMQVAAEAGLPRVPEAIAAGRAAIAAAGEGSDRAREALDIVRDWAIANIGNFDGRHNARPLGPAWLGRWEPAERSPRILARALRVVLEEHGFAPDQVLRSWADREWLVSEDNRAQTRAYVGGHQARAYQVRGEQWGVPDVEARGLFATTADNAANGDDAAF